MGLNIPRVADNAYFNGAPLAASMAHQWRCAIDGGA
jgi:hypothetical protein